MSFKIENVASVRAKDAKDKAALKAETPTTPGNTDSELEAMGRKREHDTATEKGPTIPEILANKEQGPLFKEFMQHKGVNMDSSEGVEDYHTKIADGRVEFLTQVKHVEQIRSMLTPELMQGIIKSGFINENLSFKKLVETVDHTQPGIFLDIIHKQLFTLAFKEPDRFTALANSLETIAVHQRGAEAKKGRKAESVLGRYGVSARGYEELKTDLERLAEVDGSGNLLATPEDRQEMAARLQKQVRSSKWLTGWWQKMTDDKLETWEKRLDGANEEIAGIDEEVSRILGQKVEHFSTVLGPLLDQAYQNPNDEALAARLAVASKTDDDFQAVFDTLDKKRVGPEKAIALAEQRIAVLEPKSSRGEARTLEETIPQVEGLIRTVDEQMQEISTVLQASFNESPMLREELRLAQVDAEQTLPAPSPIDSTRVGSSSKPMKQWAFDHHVVSSRGAGSVESRSKLRRSHEGGQGEGFFLISFMERLLPSLFAKGGKR